MMKTMTAILSVAILSGCANFGQQEVTVDESSETTEIIPEETGRQITQRDSDDTPVANDPYYAPVEPSKAAVPVQITGSLFNDSTSTDLYSYAPKFQVGDIINVVLEEESVATKSASTNLSNDNTYNLDPIKIPGGNLTVNDKEVELGVSQDQTFGGESGSSQSHSLSAKMTVSVIEVLNNGNLLVRGEKWLLINNGKEYIRLTGIIRPRDVTEDNSVDSYQVADSRIEFSATGEHAEMQTRGWLSSLFSGSLWPI
ncbi:MULTISPECIES: flagellar basal body L-ring protein FlgH [unclassified Psychromonas]|uniref:flagellar basal body L-ring protein FlgH n=1 Tax=unclassified Psychromonas TaxID=2614957 RepID=UPI00215DB267|nr:flagellar basal body L-ring protein FlgH [Psychromonas sp. B3M02]